MDLISIVIPIYNVKKYLNRCIDSILEQKYPNLEIILVDDGSIDGSSEVCDKYAKTDKRIKVFHKKNGGVSSARNLGIKKSKGKYITFIDADDYVSENYISDLYNNILNGYMAVYGNAIDFDDLKQYENNNIDSCSYTKNNIIKTMLDEKKIKSVCWGNLYINSIVKHVQFDEKMKIAEDFKFNIDYFDQIDENNNFYIQSEKNYYYYQREGSAIHSQFNKNWYDEINYCEGLIKKYKNTSIYPYAIKRFMRINLTCIESYKLDKEDLKNIKNNINKYKKDYLFLNITSLKHRIKFFVKYYIKRR